MIAAAAAPSLPNAAYYQAAASLLGVLLLTGVVAEVRASRDRTDNETLGQAEVLGLLGLAVLSITVVAGEAATLTTLLRQKTSGVLNVVIGISLVAGLIGVPAIAFVDHLRRVGAGVARRWVLRIGGATVAIALAIVAAFVAQTLISGEPGIGSPSSPALKATGQIEGGKILRASKNGGAGSFRDTLTVKPDSAIDVGMRVANPGPGTLSHMVVKVSLPSTSSSELISAARSRRRMRIHP